MATASRAPGIWYHAPRALAGGCERCGAGQCTGRSANIVLYLRRIVRQHPVGSLRCDRGQSLRTRAPCGEGGGVQSPTTSSGHAQPQGAGYTQHEARNPLHLIRHSTRPLGQGCARRQKICRPFRARHTRAKISAEGNRSFGAPGTNLRGAQLHYCTAALIVHPTPAISYPAMSLFAVAPRLHRQRTTHAMHSFWNKPSAGFLRCCSLGFWRGSRTAYTLRRR